MKTFWARTVLLLLFAALLASCSQNRYFSTSNRIGEAREALAKAKSAGAETKAPMDYYMAQEYINYGVKESMEGDNKQAQVFAEKSVKHSEQAIQKAGGGAK